MVRDGTNIFLLLFKVLPAHYKLFTDHPMLVFGDPSNAMKAQ